MDTQNYIPIKVQETKEKQECIPVGCVPPARWPYLAECSARGGVCSRGVSAPGGVCSGGCLLPGGVCSWGGMWHPSMHWGRHAPPPWTEFLTHAYGNITLPQTSFAGGNNEFHFRFGGNDVKGSISAITKKYKLQITGKRIRKWVSFTNFHEMFISYPQF